MPCYSITVNALDLGKVGPIAPDLLKLAMESLGIPAGQWTLQGSKVVIRATYGSDAAKITQDQIAQAYSTQVVKRTALKMGWQLKQTGANKYQVIKR